MRRKIKEGYKCLVDYICRETILCERVAGGTLQNILDGRTTTALGYLILNVRWYTPDNQSCSLESATEQIAPEVGTFWKRLNGYSANQFVADTSKCPDHYKGDNLYGNFLFIDNEGDDFRKKSFNDLIQVADWKGNPL